MSSEYFYGTARDEEEGGYDSDRQGQLPAFSDSPEYDRLKDEIAAQLFEINGQISTVHQFIQSLQKFVDNGNVNTKVVDKINKRAIANIHKIRGLIDEIKTIVQTVNDYEVTSLDKTQVISREKLNRDVRVSVQEFQNIQYEYKRIVKLINELAKEQLNENKTAVMLEQEAKHGNQTSPSQSQSQMVVEMNPINNEEFAYQQNLIQQRDQEISNIEQGITELNEIFHDLSTVVQQQGIFVDNIEANIYSVANDTSKASNELNKAMRSQKRSSKYCVYLLLILVVFLLFMLLVALI